ncbi:hypothetical protein [Nocardiopsis alkaliphila]|uniref:hypothetical protein n=1 Tax=Nocardiopsis alkaliphila TaxID=225762 RepID=UPI0003700C90|nr:hypothetical protein [Nocardiopsis alkaliphila]
MVCAILMTLCRDQICGVLAIVFAAITMSKEHEPMEQECSLRYAWTTMGIGLAITVVLVILYFLFIGAMASTY